MKYHRIYITQYISHKDVYIDIYLDKKRKIYSKHIKTHITPAPLPAHNFPHTITTTIMTSLNNNRIVTLATCNLNQWAMDFKGNYTRIKESIVQAKESGASYRLGPELEITGYGCEDHFLETDTFIHAWEILGQILDSDLTDNILCDIGMPMMFINQ